MSTDNVMSTARLLTTLVVLLTFVIKPMELIILALDPRLNIVDRISAGGTYIFSLFVGIVIIWYIFNKTIRPNTIKPRIEMG